MLIPERKVLHFEVPNSKSERKVLPGGFSAVTWLGGLLLIVKFNGACMQPPIPRPITKNHGMQVKYIDDASQLTLLT